MGLRGVLTWVDMISAALEPIHQHRVDFKNAKSLAEDLHFLVRQCLLNKVCFYFRCRFTSAVKKKKGSATASADVCLCSTRFLEDTLI